MSPPIRIAARLAPFGAYAFDELDKLCARRRDEGVDVIDFGVGDPTDPVPDAVVSACGEGLVRHRTSGYPSYIGALSFRLAAAAFLKRRFGVDCDAETQLTATLGSKEAVFHLPQAFVDPGDTVLVPVPGYPPYTAGTAFAGGRSVPYPVAAEGPLLPDLDALPQEVTERLALVWITQPHVPTGRRASLDELQRLADQCRERGALLCSDEAYSELWFDEPPASALQAGHDHVLVFQSLSKQACMTGYRIGFVAGDSDATTAFRRLKTQIDSGAPDFVQAAAVAALDDPSLSEASRRRYAERGDVLLPALRAVGCEVDMPQAGIYLWAKVPPAGAEPARLGADYDGSGLAFARALLSGPPGLAVLPGEWLGGELPDGSRPGAGRVRLALVPEAARCEAAAARLSAWGTET